MMACCPACAGTESSTVERTGTFKILRCDDCGLVFSDPMSAGDSDYYKSHLVYRASAEDALLHFRSANKTFNRKLLGRLPRGVRTLDIGCGYGGFVRLARDAGYNAFGIDFNDAQIEVGRQTLGLEGRLFHGGIGSLQEQLGFEGGFDLISLFEVIEHVETPRQLVQEAASLLKPGGLLALSCPNEARWQPTGRIFVDFPPHHLTRWKPSVLVALVCSMGFEHLATDIDASFRDLLWVAYVNRSARRKLSEGTPTVGPAASTTMRTRAVKERLDQLLKTMCLPADTILRVSGVGTMGMRLVFQKQ